METSWMDDIQAGAQNLSTLFGTYQSLDYQFSGGGSSPAPAPAPAATPAQSGVLGSGLSTQTVVLGLGGMIAAALLLKLVMR